VDRIWCGIDWAEHHHDVALVDDDGNLVAKRRIGDDAAGFTTLLGLLAEHGATSDGEQATPIAIETASGLLPAALLASGFIVYAINPLAASRYRDRYSVSRAKSDAGDAFVLANILRTDRSAHRPVPSDSELVRAVRVLARAQQEAVWNRQQEQNKLRSPLREYYPSWRRSSEKAQRYPAWPRRLLRTIRMDTTRLVPEARVTGAVPANAFTDLASAKRERSSSSSPRIRAPSTGRGQADW
jgi:transposase